MENHLKPVRFDVDPSSTNARLDWKHWFATFENFQKASKITQDADKYSLLINYINPTVYSFVSDHTTYESAIAALKEIYDKPKNILYARHLLRSTKQQSHQSLDDYIRTLRTLSQDCDFKQVTGEEYRNESIRDSFIAGINSCMIRQRILESKETGLEATFNLARTLDLAQKNADSFQNQSYALSSTLSKSEETDPSTDNNLIATVNQKSRGQSSKCWFCGRDRHPRKDCPAKDKNCGYCGRIGHFTHMCNQRPNSKNVATVIEKPYIPRLSSVSNAKSYYHKVVIDNISINGSKAEALYDTGANDNFLDKKYALENNINVIPMSYPVGLASGECSSQVVGACYVTIVVHDQKYENIKLSVMRNLVADVILGESFMKQHSSIIFKFGGEKPPLILSAMPSLNMTLPPLFSGIGPDIKPIAVKSRRFSAEDKIFIKQEVKRLLENKIIEPSVSPWRAQVLVDRDEGKKPRLCIDYSRTVNRYTIPDAYPLPRIEDMVNSVAQNKIYTTLDLKSAYHQLKLQECDIPLTAFEADGRLFHFLRLPFGLTNAIAAFQRLMDKMVDDHKLQGVFIYIDNITVAGKTQSEHDQNLKRFFEIAKKYNLTFNESKTVLNTTSVPLLGNEISDGVIKPDPGRVKSLLELPIPDNMPALARVIGLFAYYAKWIRNYSDNIRPLLQAKSMPLNNEAKTAFLKLKSLLAESSLQSIDENVPFVVETDASNFCLSATLNQGGRPVAFHSRTLSGSELHQSAVEKEAAAIIDAVRKWYYLLANKHFTLITDQRSVAYMFNKEHSNPIKNNKMMRWRMELVPMKYTIIYRSGKENHGPDTLTRAFCGAINDNELYKIHDSLIHPGIARTLHFVKSRNLPYSVEDVKRVVGRCKVCSEIKPRFFKPKNDPLVNATRPMQRINVDFKGPLPSSSANKYILTVVDEYTRYPFAFPCPDVSGSTVLKCLFQIFSIFGLPDYIHSDRGSSFISAEVTSQLHSQGIATSKTTPYNPLGNSQCERFNGTIWRTVELAVKSKNLPISKWETVITEVMHCIRSLLCTSTNKTPHELMFTFNRKTATGSSLPEWLMRPGTVLMRKHDRASKYDPRADPVHLIDCNPQYAHVKLQNGRETTVSLRDLAPLGDVDGNSNETDAEIPEKTDIENEHSQVPDAEDNDESGSFVRRSIRLSKPPDRLNYE